MKKYSGFEKREAHPSEKYIGRFVRHRSGILEVVGYAVRPDGLCWLIVDASRIGGWPQLGTCDVVFKECESYWRVSVDGLID